MQSIHPTEDHFCPRSKLGASLMRLHRHVEGSQQRDQQALDLFEEWQSRWSEYREVIARRLAWLDDELSKMVTSEIPAPHLSLASFCEKPPEETREEEVEELRSSHLAFVPRS